MVAVSCAKCGVVFEAPDQFINERRRLHDSFYCPSGHSNYFPDQTPEEKRIASLERQLEVSRRNLTDRLHDLLTDRDDWRELAKRCPICGENVAPRLRVHENITARLADHLMFEHGAVARRRALTMGDAA